MTALERGYRRLLALYPAAYRAEYEEEMVGVLLASSTPERRRPNLREAADLVWAAVMVRLGRRRGTTRDTLWTRALATLGAVGALLLLGKSLRPIAKSLGWTLSFNYPFGERPDGLLSEVDWIRAAVWALVVVAVLLRWRLAAAALTWVAVLGEVALLGWTPPAYWYWFPPDQTALGEIWPAVLAGLVAVALTLGVRAPAGVVTLGWRRAPLVGLATAVAAAGAVVPPLFADTEAGEFDGAAIAIPQWATSAAAWGAGAVIAVLLAAVVFSLDRPLRRRVLGLAASAVTLVVTVNLSLDHAFAGAVFVWPTVIPHSVQWPLVVLAPAVVLLVSVLVIRLREQDRPAQVA